MHVEKYSPQDVTILEDPPNLHRHQGLVEEDVSVQGTRERGFEK